MLQVSPLQSAKKIKAARVLTENGWMDNATVSINQEGNISTISTQDNNAFDLDDLWLMPALVDSHIHGALGCDVMDASHEALTVISTYLAQYGVGAFAATTVTAEMSKIDAALIQVRKSKKIGLPGADIIGTYLEGPYLSANCCGAHPIQLMRPINIEELRHWHQLAEGTLSTVALAAELLGSGEAIAFLQSLGVRVLIGHSDASYTETIDAINAGARGIVHCYNGMRGLHHREPGVVGAGLTHSSSDVELIADGHHVHPAAAKIAYLSAGAKRFILISDGMRATGMGDGAYALGELTVHMKDGIVRTDMGGLAGSTLHLIDGVRNVMKWFDLPLEEAWTFASRNPAHALKRTDLGDIAPHKKASMVAVNTQLEVMATWVNGRLVWQDGTML